jgi:carbon starvation protein CstA
MLWCRLNLGTICPLILQSITAVEGWVQALLWVEAEGVLVLVVQDFMWMISASVAMTALPKRSHRRMPRDMSRYVHVLVLLIIYD